MTIVASFEKATLYYVSGMFGYHKTEAKNVTIELIRYAQYDRAYKVTFVPKGKRSPKAFVKCGINSPFIVVKGFDNPDVASWLTPEEGGGSMSRYSSCDPRWQSEFDAAIVKHGVEVAFDGRGAIAEAAPSAA